MKAVLRSHQGFTIIEVLVAMFVLLVGLVGTFALVDAANGRGTASKGREGSTTLAREITEQVRAMSYSELTPALLLLRLQEKPGLADASAGAGWQINRRGFEYTVATSVCAIDDPGDAYGSHSAGGFCADSTGTGTEDASPEDLKRITITTSFSDRGRTVTSRSVSTLNSTGQVSGLPVSALALSATDPATTISSPTEPVIGTPVNQLIFRVTTPSTAAKVVWTVEGQRGSPIATRIDATTWEFRWGVAGVSDGTYAVGAQAVDAKGEVGPPREMPVRLARHTPPAPAALRGGYNEVRRAGTTYPEAAEFEWPASPQRSIEGYRLYRGNGSLACPASAAVISTATSCVDETPPAATGTTDAARTYRVVALYRDAGDVLRETPGATRRIDPVSTSTTVANPPTTASTDHAYKLQNSFANNAAPCAGGTLRDLRDNVFGATGTLGGPNVEATFCTPPFVPGTNQVHQVPAVAATIRLYVRTVLNSQNTCTVTARLKRLGATETLLAGPLSRTFNRHSSDEYLLWNTGTLPATQMAPGDKLAVHLRWSGEPECTKLTLLYGGTASPGELNIRTSLVTTTYSTQTTTTRPNAPSGLTATAQADGTTKLTWTKPAGGAPYTFYRVYADGIEWDVNRLTTAAVDDTAGATTDSEVVPGGARTYRVTAVAPTMTESPFSAAVSVP